HTFDVETKAHARFAGKGECPIDHEHVAKIVGRELHSDATCSPGCPSIPYTAHGNVYDVASGKMLRHWQGATEPSFYDEANGKIQAIEKLAVELHVAADDDVY